MTHDERGAPQEAADFLHGGGEMGALMRAHDWSRSSLGPPAAWPQSLRTAVRLLLNTGHPMYIWWGEDGACLYNDAYRQSIGPERHPGSLGRPAREVWDEIWNIIGPQIEQVRAGRGATWHEDQLVPITRHGRREDVYWTYSFSPIDEAAAPNGVGGVLVVCSETTANVLARQRAAAAAERQQRLFEGAPGFIAILRGPEHHFEFVNAAYARLVGRRELVGRTPREALPEVEGQGFFELLDRVYATGERYKALGVPIRLRRSGDAAPERRLLDFIYEPIVEENGRVTGIFVEGHDVTETYLAQEALRANERRQALLVELGDRFRDLDDPADISFAAAELLGRALEVSRAGYGTIDPVAETIAIERDWNAPGIDSVAGVHNFRDYGSYIDDLKRGETVVVADAGKDPRTAANADALAAIGVGALVNLPLTEQGGFVALFYLNHASPREWSEVELDFVREVGERTRTAVERRRAEGELRDLAVSLERKVEQRTAERDRLWELSEDLLVVADYEGRLLRLSPSWTRVLGHEQQTLLTRRYDSFIHPDDREAVKAALGAMRTSGRPVHFEDRLLAADGSWRWIAWTLSPEPGGRRLTGVGRDVTKAREAAEALRRSEARLRAIFESGYQYQGLLAPDGTLQDANAASLAGIGCRLEEVVGRPLWETPWIAATPGLSERVRAAVSAVARGATLRRELLVELPTGRRWFDFTMRPLRGEDGAIVALVPEALDITERRHAEEVLRQTQKLEAMGQLTGGVAHDFNNLLTPIIGSLDMLRRRGLRGEREERLVAAALQSADRARTLVQRLLAFARRQPLQAAPVDLAGLVAGMAELVASTTGPQIKVAVEVAEDLPPALADANQLEMAILNLAVNARDAMADGGTLRISAGAEQVGAGHRSKLPPGAYLHLSVADTGAGMDAATLARAIEPFFSTKGIGKGTGLGLSMVHGLMAQLGGALTLTSRPGLGTNVELWLPRADAAAPAAEADEQAAPAPRARGRLLLVDDEALVRQSAAAMLDDAGYEVVEARSAEEALRLFDQGLEVDLLVTDHLMPGRSGAELARLARHRHPGLPVLIVSGYADADDIPDLPRLAKPFLQAELVAAVARLTEAGEG